MPPRRAWAWRRWSWLLFYELCMAGLLPARGTGCPVIPSVLHGASSGNLSSFARLACAVPPKKEEAYAPGPRD